MNPHVENHCDSLLLKIIFITFQNINKIGYVGPLNLIRFGCFPLVIKELCVGYYGKTSRQS